MPRYLGRIDVPDPAKLPPEAKILIDETVMPERPEVFVMLTGDGIEVQPNGGISLPYVRPTRPHWRAEYWRHGQEISLEEALPYLRAALGEEWQAWPASAV
jgi:hypothetical protein